MDYLDLYHHLEKLVNFSDDVIRSGPLNIHNITFHSDFHSILPGVEEYFCDLHQVSFHENPALPDLHPPDDSLMIPDPNILTNETFRIHIFKPVLPEKAKGILLLFHGFNERFWEKYLPWAQVLAESTGTAVVLFPIAFHMNRALGEWSNTRKMFRLSQERKKEFPDVIHSSLSNVAISIRIHSNPQRFIWSGLQTFNDVIQFIRECRSGRYSFIDPDCSVDFFSYSVGSLLCEILKLTNPEGIFSDSKACMFCGGAVFNRLSPVSKFILDSQANVALYSYLVEHLDSHLRHDPRLAHYLGTDHPEGMVFRCMLNYRKMIEYREKRFREISGQVLAIGLEQDLVIPSYEMINTLQGTKRDIKIPVEVHDFPYPYIHEDPFPVKKEIRKEVDNAFRMIFERVSRFYSE